MNEWKTISQGLLVSLLILAITGLFIWLMTSLLHVQQVALLAPLTLLPLAIYLVGIGRLQEFGLIKLNNELRKPLAINNVGWTTPVGIFAKGATEELDEVISNIANLANDYQYFVLTVTLGWNDFYKPPALLKYLKTCSQFPGFKFLVILEGDGKIFAYLSGWRAIQILEYQLNNYGHSPFVDAVNEGRKPLLMNYQPITITVKETHTAPQVLDVLINQNTDALLVADQDGKLKGLVEQKQVLSKIMLAITK